MSVVKVHNKARNITYVYESVSYWDKELKQPRSHRKLIGRIDPVTGDIVPTRKRKSSSSNPISSSHSDTDYKALYEQALSTIKEKEVLISDLSSRLSTIEKDLISCQRSMEKACEILATSGKERING